MEFNVSSAPLATLTTDAIVLLLGSEAPQLSAALPQETRDYLQALLDSGDIKGAKDQLRWLYQVPGIAAKRLLIAGYGDKAPSPVAAANLFEKIGKTLSASPVTHATLVIDVALGLPPVWQVREGTRAMVAGGYRFDEYRSKAKPASTFTQLTWWCENDDAEFVAACAQGQATGNGVNLCRDLGNRPPNDCHPESLTALAHELANEFPKLKVSVIDEQQAEEMGMGAFCSVARGSERQGQIITMEFQGAPASEEGPVALVGKGITFDTGGISLKPGANMDEMKYDMGGAASVFGTVRAVCEMDLPLHVVAVIAAAENMPDGRASRPGDIVKTLSGQTVEILNTDAEGRLVLCDALTYVQDTFKPRAIVDIATLTGACVVALGAHAQAVYSNDESLGKALLDAGEQSADRGWPMPLWDDYQNQLDSPFADMQNIGGPKAGSITAACFLSRFTKQSKWAHLDIAGVAWTSGGMSKGSTGRPVPMLTRYLINQCS